MARVKFWIFALAAFALLGYGLVRHTREVHQRIEEGAKARLETGLDALKLLDRAERAELARVIERAAVSPSLQELLTQHPGEPPSTAAIAAAHEAVLESLGAELSPTAQAHLRAAALVLVESGAHLVSVRGESAPVEISEPATYALEEASTPALRGTVRALPGGLFRIAAVPVTPAGPTLPSRSDVVSPPPPPRVAIAIPLDDAAVATWTRALGLDVTLAGPKGVASSLSEAVRDPVLAAGEGPEGTFPTETLFGHIAFPLLSSRTPAHWSRAMPLPGSEGVHALLTTSPQGLHSLAGFQKRALIALFALLILAMVLSFTLGTRRPAARAEPAPMGPKSPVPPMPTPPSPIPPEQRAASTPTLAPPAPSEPDESDAFRALYEQFLAMRASLGEPTDRVDYDRFTDKLRKSRDELIAKHGSPIRFSIEEKEGHTAIRALPISSAPTSHP